jgi:hypothetical protein
MPAPGSGCAVKERLIGAYCGYSGLVSSPFGPVRAEAQAESIQAAQKQCPVWAHGYGSQWIQTDGIWCLVKSSMFDSEPSVSMHKSAWLAFHVGSVCQQRTSAVPLATCSETEFYEMLCQVNWLEIGWSLVNNMLT